MPIHLYGSCDMKTIMQIALEHGLFVIETCAEAIGSEYEEHCGSYWSDTTRTDRYILDGYQHG